MVFPGDNLITSFSTKISLGLQAVDIHSSLPYCLIGHMSQRLNWKTDEAIQWEIESIIEATNANTLCRPYERRMRQARAARTTYCPRRVAKDKRIIIAYEPWFAIGTGKTMTLEDIEIVHHILREALKEFTNKKHSLRRQCQWYKYHTNSQNNRWRHHRHCKPKSSSLLALSIALWQE